MHLQKAVVLSLCHCRTAVSSSQAYLVQTGTNEAEDRAKADPRHQDLSLSPEAASNSGLSITGAVAVFIWTPQI